MKKFLILFLAVMFAVTTSSAFGTTLSAGNEYMNVQNESHTADFDLLHTVGRISYFKAIITSTLIEQAGTTTVGRLVVRNNTRDGFKLSVISDKNGIMEPSSDLDGETPIPYDLRFTIKGDVGEGLNSFRDVTKSQLEGGTVDIIAKPAADGVVSSPTDATLSVGVVVVDDSNVLSMAGSYADTLTFTYEDI